MNAKTGQMTTEKALVAIDGLLDTINQLKLDLHDARNWAEFWRRECGDIMKKPDMERSYPLPWENAELSDQ